MNRRTFIRASGAALTATLIGLAGCSDDQNSPPPRKSSVIADVGVSSDTNALVTELEPAGDRWVQTRRNINSSNVEQPSSEEDNTTQSAVPTSVSLIGTARAAKGRGATSRSSTSYDSAPKTSKNRAYYGGGAYVGTWYNNHDDEVEQYPVTADTIGVAYIGGDSQFTEQDPGPGPLDWDETINEPDGTVRSSVNDAAPGWYRIGTNVIVPGENVDLGWESIDARIETENGTPTVTKEWKVSPRI